ncbi:MAG: hypothetical protein IPG97_06475 [Microthrixaceae bacterium]|jgi:hypothetical protein|nr:hypothetical protein [Microthrixaceae bacterium]
MVTITASLAPATAGAVCAVIDAHVTRSAAPAGASLPQQRADALAEIATNGGNNVGRGGDPRSRRRHHPGRRHPHQNDLANEAGTETAD